MVFKIREMKTPNKGLIPLSLRDNREPEVLTDEYVQGLNREISYRIQQREASHAGAEELAAKARFR